MKAQDRKIIPVVLIKMKTTATIYLMGTLMIQTVTIMLPMLIMETMLNTMENMVMIIMNKTTMKIKL